MIYPFVKSTGLHHFLQEYHHWTALDELVTLRYSDCEIIQVKIGLICVPSRLYKPSLSAQISPFLSLSTVALSYKASRAWMILMQCQ